MKKMTVLSMLLGSLALASVGAAAEAAALKICAVDMRRVLSEAPGIKALQKEVDTELRKQEQSQQQRIADLRAQGQEYSKRAPALSDEARETELLALASREARLKADLQLEQEEFKTRMQRREKNVHADIVRQSRDLLMAEGWGLIVDSSAPNVVAVNEALDVTAEVLKHLGASSDVKA